MKPKPKLKPNLNQFDYSRPLKPDQVKGFVDAATKLRYGDQTQDLIRQRKQMPTWFQNYRDALNTGRAATEASYTAAIDQQHKSQDAAAVRDLQAGADPNAAAAQRAQSDAFAGLLASQSLSAQNRFRDLSAISGGEEIQAKQRMNDAFSALRAEKGAFRQQTLRDVIDSERKYGLEQAAFGLDTVKANQDYAIGRQKLRDQRRSDRLDRQDKQQTRADRLHDADGDGVPDSQDPAPSTPGDLRPNQIPGKNGLTPAEQRARQKRAADVMSALNNAIAAGRSAYDDPGIQQGDVRQNIISALTSGHYDPVFRKPGVQAVDPNTGIPIFSGQKVKDTEAINAALDVILNGGIIDRPNRLALRRRGARKRDLAPYRPKKRNPQQDRPGPQGH